MNKQITLFIGCMILLTVSGCAALLPRGSTVTKSPWKSYGEVVNAYEKVVPHKSTVHDIKKLGFDIYSTPNLKILSYVDVAVSTQTLKKDEISSGILTCLKVQNLCNGYVFEPQVAKSKRYGNFWLDTFKFKRKTKESGWRFKAAFLVVDDIVVDKYWSGEPKIDRDSEAVNPLGPLQDLGNMIKVPTFGY